MKVIGLTGGIGSGKSTVSRYLAELGATIIDSDRVGHEMFKPGTGSWQEVVDAFGERVLNPDGDIDRSKLGEIVFQSTDYMNRLNRIMHPRMYEVVKSRLDDYRQQGVGVAVLEAPLLVEAGWASLVDEVWVTVAPESGVLERIGVRDELSRADILARIRSQLNSEERAKYADIVIDTDCSLDKLRAKVEELWDRLQLDTHTQ